MGCKDPKCACRLDRGAGLDWTAQARKIENARDELQKLGFDSSPAYATNAVICRTCGAYVPFVAAQGDLMYARRHFGWHWGEQA